MKRKLLLFIGCVILLEFANAQNWKAASSQKVIKEFDLWPVLDSQVQEYVNGELVGYIPYDFYLAKNCPVPHTLDTVFYNDFSLHNETLTIESNAPCYAIIYGMHLGEVVDMSFYPINTYVNGKYKKSINIYDFENNLYRVVVSQGNTVFKKAIENDIPIISLSGVNDGKAESLTSTEQAFTPHCSIKIYNTDGGLTKQIEGDLSSNVFFLYGDGLKMMTKDYYDASLPHEPYCIFTSQSTNDVEMFLVNSNNEIIGHNNNYSGESDYNWGAEARIDLSGNDSLQAIVILPYRPYMEHENDYFNFGDEYACPDDNPDGTTDLYIGCKFFSMNKMNYYFPNLKSKDALITDLPRTYNCHRWTAYPTTYLFRQPYLTGLTHTASSIAFYLCHYHGFTESGATEENSDVDIWEHNGYATHTSVRSYGGGAGGNSYGYDWESKLGSNKRIMHPRYALVNDDANNDGAYGHVVKHLIKDPYYVAQEIVYENVSFSEEEIAQIDSLVNHISQVDEALFTSFYLEIEDSVFQKCINNLGLLAVYDKNYKKLVDVSKDKTSFQGLLMRKMASGDALAAHLFIDATKNENPIAIEAVLNYEKQHVTNSKGEVVVRMDISEAILYAKEVLAQMRGSWLQNLNDYINYSNEGNHFSLEVVGKTVYVAFNLEKEALVSLYLENVQNPMSKPLLDGKVLDAGTHRFSTSVGTSGIYSISLLKNGQVFTKKIKIN